MALLFALLLSLFANLALAVEPSEILPDPALERRARDIGRQLRCVVCQNQSIDDSSAEVARDMRRAVRERLTAGYNDAQVFDYMVARYGDYVLLNPPFKAETWALWLGGPLVLLLAGGTLLFAARRRTRVPLAPPPLTAHERERLAAVLGAARATRQPHPEEQPQAASRRVGPGNEQANDRGPGA
jgi:cytochrome c-type biogenesis protein CcmH